MGERGASEAPLEDRWASYRELFESASDFILIVGPDMRLRFANAAFRARMGVSEDEISRLSIPDLLAPDSQEACLESFGRIAAGERLEQIEAVFLTRSGERIGVEGACHARFRDGRLDVVRGIFRDVTARRRAEAELQERERRLSTLISNLPGIAYRCRYDAVFTTDFVSDGAAAISGYPAQDFQTNRRRFGDLIHPDDRERVAAEIEAALQKDEPYELTYRIQTASGAQKWVWEKGRGIRDAAGNVEALEGLVTISPSRSDWSGS